MENLFKGKKRPWVIGGIVIVGAIILFSLLRGGGNSAVISGPSENLQAANLQAQTALQAQSMDIQGQIAVAGIQQNMRAMELEYTLAQFDRQQSYELQSLELQGQIASQQISTQREIMLAQEQGAIYRDQLAAQVAQSQLEGQVALQQYGIGAQVAIAELAAHVQQGQTQAMIEMSGHQSSVALAQIQAQADIQSQQIEASKQVEFALSRERTKGQTKGMLGSIAGGILGLFSDARLKTRIVELGKNDDGSSNYSWSYTGDSARFIGPMAQEVEWAQPEAFLPLAGGSAIDFSRYVPA